MYAGTTLTPASGRILGAHQKIDRLARACLAHELTDKANAAFPAVKSILHFEGSRGPDAIKRKSPAVDEPWHYYSPFGEADQSFMSTLSVHYESLVRALSGRDDVRGGFEAAWLAHAIVDGLTPAHHFPYEEHLAELRGGQPKESRTTYRDKLVMTGESGRATLRNNWQMWGPKGLLTSHIWFELGVALAIAPASSKFRLKPGAVQELRQHGLEKLFHRKAQEVAALQIYDSFSKVGWTPRLAWRTKHRLLPILVQTVALAWYAAAQEAGLVVES